MNSTFLESPRISPRFKRQAPQDSKSNMPKSVYTAAYSFYPVNRAYVPEKTHIFKKTMPFRQVFTEITSLQFNLKYMSPNTDDPTQITIKGRQADFIMTNFPRNPNQAALTCAELGGQIADLKTILTEQLPIRYKILTSDTITTKDGLLICELYGQRKDNIQCLENIKNIAFLLKHTDEKNLVH